MAKVLLTDDALEDLRGLGGSARKLGIKALGKLRDSPELRGAPLGSRRTGNLTGFRKVVVGDRQYRIVYRVEDDGTICVVWVIGSRVDEECYRIAAARLELHADPKIAAEMGEALETLWRRECPTDLTCGRSTPPTMSGPASRLGPTSSSPTGRYPAWA